MEKVEPKNGANVKIFYCKDDLRVTTSYIKSITFSPKKLDFELDTDFGIEHKMVESPKPSEYYIIEDMKLADICEIVNRMSEGVLEPIF